MCVVRVCSVGMWLKAQQGCSRRSIASAPVRKPRTTDITGHSNGFLNLDVNLLHEVELSERLCLNVLNEVVSTLHNNLRSL